MAKKKKSREMADGIMTGIREIQSWLDKGCGPEQIKQHLRENHPDRIREPLVIPQPGKYPPAKVKALRVQLGLRQGDFAGLLGVSAILVQSWERGVREPSLLARRLLDVVSRDPSAWLASLSAKAPTAATRRRVGWSEAH
jgi:DNA-binding transcriptional regulator YiaG